MKTLRIRAIAKAAGYRLRQSNSPKHTVFDKTFFELKLKTKNNGNSQYIFYDKNKTKAAILYRLKQ